MFTITRKDDPSQTATVAPVDLMAACERLSEGGRFALDVTSLPDAPTIAPPLLSTFERPVIDLDAKTRIDAQQAALRAAGLSGIGHAETGGDGEQFFANGTRMITEGYASQAARKIEHEAKTSLRDAADALSATVVAEQRRDVTINARDLADGLHVNGAITVNGYTLTEQAIRGLAVRLESPMLGYVLGLRDRMRNRRADSETAPAVIKAANDADRAEIATVLRHECLANPDAELKLRMRERGAHSRPDVFALVSPSYSPADAPEAIGQLLRGLPADARGSFAYDQASTTWELRAEVWTPTPVAEQAVGEPFEGYVSFRSRDNGTSSFRGGGGIVLLRCLNASTYTSATADARRRHTGNVLYDVERMLRQARIAIDTLCDVWGKSRNETIDVPIGADAVPVPIEVAIPGFWSYALRDRRSELATVLPGRSATHVEGLTAAYFSERRDSSRIVRSDFAQGWTKYIQSQGADVRREAESAIADWMVNDRPMACELTTV